MAAKMTFFMLRQGYFNYTCFDYLPLVYRQTKLSPKKDRTRSLRRWNDRILKGIQKWINEEDIISFPSLKDWVHDTRTAKGNYKEEFGEYLMMYVDGTVVQVFAPLDPGISKSLFNSKHGITSWQFFVIVTLTGRIVYFSAVEAGKMHDKTHWEKEKVGEHLFDHFSQLSSYSKGKVRFDKKWYTCSVSGDKAYKALVLPDGWHLFITKSGENHDVEIEQFAHDEGITIEVATERKRKEREEAGVEKRKKRKLLEGVESNTEEEEHYDPLVARYRCVVERVMIALKRWKVLTSQYHMSGYEKASMIMECCAGLTNYQLLKDCSGHW
jgi:hypothetical protein